MKNIKITFALILLSCSAQAQNWNIDFAHSSINFSVTHFFTPVTGKFQKFTGTLEFNPEQPLNSKIDFVVDIESVNTDNARRDTDLKSGNFFDAAKFPTMSFVSDRVEKKSANQYVAYGKLTIRDVSKNVEIPFIVLGYGEHPRRKENKILAIKSEFLIKRIEYGVGSGNWVATNVVSDDVNVSVFLEATSKK